MFSHEYFMRLALKEARKGLGFTSPNPMVGALIVKENHILASGFHQCDGAQHAEVNALKKIPIGAAKNATLYVTLEPCCHYGRTPPCTNAIIDSGVSRVVVASVDPDSRVNSKGLEILRSKGIEVITGVCEQESKDLNSIYFFNRIHKRPYVVLKAALTLDGKISTHNGHSQWISNEKSREVVHKLRRRLKSVLIGKGTLIKDKPRLNCRLEGCENKPVDKIVLSKLSSPDLTTGEPTSFEGPGNIYFLNSDFTQNASSFFEFCQSKNIDSVLIEGGSQVYSWALKNKIVDRVFLFYKPSFLGSDGLPLINNCDVSSISDLNEFQIADVKILDNNIFLDLYVGEALCLLES